MGSLLFGRSGCGCIVVIVRRLWGFWRCGVSVVEVWVLRVVGGIIGVVFWRRCLSGSFDVIVCIGIRI